MAVLRTALQAQEEIQKASQALVRSDLVTRELMEAIVNAIALMNVVITDLVLAEEAQRK